MRIDPNYRGQFPLIRFAPHLGQRVKRRSSYGFRKKSYCAGSLPNGLFPSSLIPFEGAASISLEMGIFILYVEESNLN
jgi:hypothetical protein